MGPSLPLSPCKYIDRQKVKRALKHAFSNWKIAIVMDVHVVAGEQDNNRLNLDFSSEPPRFFYFIITCSFSFSAARFCESRSHFGAGTTADEPMFSTLRTAFILHITQNYLPTLEASQHGQIDHLDIRILELEDEPADSPAPTERISVNDTFGFDVVTAVSQGSVNRYLRTLWSAGDTCLDTWCFEESFRSSFGAPQIELLCDPKSRSDLVLLYIDLREGFLTTLDSEKTPIQ